MNRTAGSDVQQDVDAGTRDLTVSSQPAAGAPSQSAEPPPADEAGHQVVVGDIPAEPPGFWPRAGLLGELDRTGARVTVIHPLTGRPGAGTTHLAAAYARAKVAAGWPLVAWVNGADTGSLLEGLAAVADAAGLSYDDPGPGITDAAATVRPWLEAGGDGCLLVFDNVSDPERLNEFVPARGAARVLITSARQSAAIPGTAVPVDVFTAAEASAFLAARTNLDDKAGAARVAAALENLPLALALAAPLITGQDAGYASYLDRLEATSADVSLTGDDGQPYPLSLERTVLLSLQAVRTADRTGVCTRVVEIMSVLSAAGVRRELLYAAGQAGVLASGRHRVAAGSVDRVLTWLSDRSLLTFSLDGQTVVLHPPVARVVRNELKRRQMVTAACEAAAFVLDVYSRSLVGSQARRAIRGIPQQVTALVDSLAGPVARVDEELAWLLLRLRFAAFYHLLELGDSTPLAIAVGEPLARDLDRLLGPDHPDTLNSRNSLAAAYLAAGRVAEAIPLFEQTLAMRQRTLGLDDPETLTSQNNLASAYQDAGRTAEAIRLYELNLEVRERLLGPDHPSTLNSRGNLAAAYQDAGRAAEAIPLLERTLADRERVLGPDHPDARTSRKNLAKAYQNAGRTAEAIPLLERDRVDRKGVPRSDHPGSGTAPGNLSDSGRAVKGTADALPADAPASAAWKGQAPETSPGPGLPDGFRRPPVDQARRSLPGGLRRPPADPVRRPLPRGVTRPPVKPADQSSSQIEDRPEEVREDREIVTAVTADGRAGAAMLYDRYAADLYDYCHWMLHDREEAAAALKNTFVVAVTTLEDLPAPARLRPWLFALARSEGRRRIRPGSAAGDEETDAAGEPAEVVPEVPDVTREASEASRAASEASRAASDATVTFRAVGLPPAATREVSREASDATVTFRAITPLSVPARGVSEVPREASDATVTFRAVGSSSDAAPRASDATMSFPVVSLASDATMPFRVVSQPVSGLLRPHDDSGEAALRTLIYAILAGLKPREREVVELHFRHDLHEDDLAIALGVSWSRAHALATRTRGRLEVALNALHIALTGRETCPVLGELLADWDGQLTEDTRDLVSWHIGECQTCSHHGWGALRPAAFSRLLPPAQLPAELRDQILSSCTSTTEDAVAYRWRAVRRADSIWFTTFSRVIRHMTWASIRANPGRAIVAVAVAAWVAAAVSVMLLTFAGSHAAYAQAALHSAAPADAPPASAGTSSESPTLAPATKTARSAASADASPTFTRPAVSYPVSPSPGVLRSPSASPKPSKSASAKPSKSPSASPSKSPSASPSASSSPSASPSSTTP